MLQHAIRKLAKNKFPWSKSFLQDLVAFSKQHDIKLITHNDDRVILPQENLDSALSSALEGREVDHTPWTPSWVARYSSIIKLRGIIAHKGYLVKLRTGSQS